MRQMRSLFIALLVIHVAVGDLLGGIGLGGIVGDGSDDEQTASDVTNLPVDVQTDVSGDGGGGLLGGGLLGGGLLSSVGGDGGLGGGLLSSVGGGGLDGGLGGGLLSTVGNLPGLGGGGGLSGNLVSTVGGGLGGGLLSTVGGGGGLLSTVGGGGELLSNLPGVGGGLGFVTSLAPTLISTIGPTISTLTSASSKVFAVTKTLSTISSSATNAISTITTLTTSITTVFSSVTQIATDASGGLGQSPIPLTSAISGVQDATHSFIQNFNQPSLPVTNEIVGPSITQVIQSVQKFVRVARTYTQTAYVQLSSDNQVAQQTIVHVSKIVVTLQTVVQIASTTITSLTNYERLQQNVQITQTFTTVIKRIEVIVNSFSTKYTSVTVIKQTLQNIVQRLDGLNTVFPSTYPTILPSVVGPSPVVTSILPTQDILPIINPTPILNPVDASQSFISEPSVVPVNVDVSPTINNSPIITTSPVISNPIVDLPSQIEPDQRSYLETRPGDSLPNSPVQYVDGDDRPNDYDDRPSVNYQPDDDDNRPGSFYAQPDDRTPYYNQPDDQTYDQPDYDDDQSTSSVYPTQSYIGRLGPLYRRLHSSFRRIHRYVTKYIRHVTSNHPRLRHRILTQLNSVLRIGYDLQRYIADLRPHEIRPFLHYIQRSHIQSQHRLAHLMNSFAQLKPRLSQPQERIVNELTEIIIYLLRTTQTIIRRTVQRIQSSPGSSITTIKVRLLRRLINAFENVDLPTQQYITPRSVDENAPSFGDDEPGSTYDDGPYNSPSFLSRSPIRHIGTLPTSGIIGTQPIDDEQTVIDTQPINDYTTVIHPQPISVGSTTVVQTQQQPSSSVVTTSTIDEQPTVIQAPLTTSTTQTQSVSTASTASTTTDQTIIQPQPIIAIPHTVTTTNYQSTSPAFIQSQSAPIITQTNYPDDDIPLIQPRITRTYQTPDYESTSPTFVQTQSTPIITDTNYPDHEIPQIQPQFTRITTLPDQQPYYPSTDYVDDTPDYPNSPSFASIRPTGLRPHNIIRSSPSQTIYYPRRPNPIRYMQHVDNIPSVAYAPSYVPSVTPYIQPSSVTSVTHAQASASATSSSSSTTVTSSNGGIPSWNTCNPISSGTHIFRIYLRTLNNVFNRIVNEIHPLSPLTANTIITRVHQVHFSIHTLILYVSQLNVNIIDTITSSNIIYNGFREIQYHLRQLVRTIQSTNYDQIPNGLRNISLVRVVKYTSAIVAITIGEVRRLLSNLSYQTSPALPIYNVLLRLINAYRRVLRDRYDGLADTDGGFSFLQRGLDYGQDDYTPIYRGLSQGTAQVMDNSIVGVAQTVDQVSNDYRNELQNIERIVGSRLGDGHPAVQYLQHLAGLMGRNNGQLDRVQQHLDAVLNVLRNLRSYDGNGNFGSVNPVSGVSSSSSSSASASASSSASSWDSSGWRSGSSSSASASASSRSSVVYSKALQLGDQMTDYLYKYSGFPQVY